MIVRKYFGTSPIAWVFAIVLIGIFFLNAKPVHAQTFFRASSAQRTAAVQSQAINIILNGQNISFETVPATNIFTIQGSTGDYQNYGVFAVPGLNQTGNLTVEVQVGEPIYLFELQVVAWIPIDGGILILIQYDVMSDTEGQVVSVIQDLNNGDTSANGPSNFVFNFNNGQQQSSRRRSHEGPETKQDSKVFESIMHNLQHHGKDWTSNRNTNHQHKRRAEASTKTRATIKGGAARDWLMQQYVTDSLTSELNKPATHNKRSFSNFADSIPEFIWASKPERVMGGASVTNHEPKFFLPHDSLDEVYTDGVPHYLQHNAFIHSSNMAPYAIPGRMKQSVLENMKHDIHDAINGKNTKRNLISGLAATVEAQSDFFKSVGGTCKAVALGAGFINGLDTACLYEALNAVGGSLYGVQEQIANLINATDEIIEAANLTNQAILKLNEATALQQDQINLIKDQILDVYDELAKNDYKFNDLAVAQAVSSESQLLLSSVIQLLDGQVARAAWVNDQNFAATQSAFNGVTATLNEAIAVQNTNLEFLRLQQQNAAIGSAKAFYTDLAYVAVQSNQLVQELRLETNIQMNYVTETSNLANSQSLAYINQVVAQLGYLQNVVNNIFPAIRDLQRMTLGNTDLSIQYFLYKNLIVATPNTTDAQGYHMVALDGTGRPSTPININVTRDGWEFNASWIDTSVPCVANNINTIFGAMNTNMSLYNQIPLLVPDDLNPTLMQTEKNVIVSPTFPFALVGSTTSAQNFYYLTFYVNEIPNNAYLMMVNTANIQDPNSVVLQPDTPTNRLCTQASPCSGYFAPTFFLAKWRSVPNGYPGTSVREQTAAALLYEFGGTIYYLDVGSDGFMYLNQYTMTNTSAQNIEMMWVFQNYPLLGHETENYLLQTRIPQKGPMLLQPFQSDNFLNSSLYPSTVNQTLWRYNVTLQIHNPSNSSAYTIKNFLMYTSTFNIVYLTLNQNSLSETELNATIAEIMLFYNASLAGSRKRSPGETHLERINNLLLPSDWRDKIPKFEESRAGTILEKTVEGVHYQTARTLSKHQQDEFHAKDKKHTNGKRALSPAGLEQQPASMDECWQGNAGIGNARFTYDDLASFLDGNPTDTRPSSTQIRQCVSNPGCMIYQLQYPDTIMYQMAAGPFTLLNGNTSFSLKQTETGLLDIDELGHVQGNNGNYLVVPYGYDLYMQDYFSDRPTTPFPLTIRLMDTPYCVANATICQPRSHLFWIIGFYAAQKSVNYGGILMFLEPNPAETDFKVQLQCAPFNPGLISGLNNNGVYREPPWPYVDQGPWGNNASFHYDAVDTSRLQWAFPGSNSPTPMLYDFSTYGANVAVSMPNCTLIDYVGCISPTLVGLCQQGVTVGTSVASPGGKDMVAGCVDSEYDYGCIGLNYSACIYATQVGVNNQSVPVCAYDYNTQACRNYNPVEDPIFIVNQAPTNQINIGVACELRALDSFSCSFDGYCMFQNVLGNVVDVPQFTSTCVPLGRNALSAPFYVPNTPSFNPTAYTLADLAPFGITNLTVYQCSDAAVYCTVYGGTSNATDFSTNMNWIFDALDAINGTVCEQLSITLTDVGSCTNRLYYFDATNSQYKPMCRLANNRRCQQDCDNFGTDLNQCLSPDLGYCYINQNTLNCFNLDDAASVCPTYITSPNVLGSQCIGSINVCTLLQANRNMNGQVINRNTGPNQLNGWSRDLVAGSECLVLAGFVGGVLNTSLSTSPRLSGVVSLPDQLENSCLAYIDASANIMCWPVSVVPGADSEVFSVLNPADGPNFIDFTLGQQTCRYDNVFDCLTATELNSYQLACGWIESGSNSLGLCTTLFNLPRLIDLYGSFITVYDQAGYMRANAVISENMNLTGTQITALGYVSSTDFHIPGPGDDYNALSNQIVIIGPPIVTCPAPYYAVGSLCCQTPNCYNGEGQAWYRNLNHPKWMFLVEAQNICLTSSDKWSLSTSSTINIVCTEQPSYSPVEYDPSLQSTQIAINLLYAIIATNGTLPPVQENYLCTPMMQPYLAPVVFPFQFANEVPNAISNTMDNFGNLTNVTLTPLQRFTPGNPLYNGTFLLAPTYQFRPLQSPRFTYLGANYQFDPIMAFSAQDISFAHAPLDMSSLTEQVTAGQVGPASSTGWTVTDFVATQLQVNLTRNIGSFMTTANNIYGTTPQGWGAREEFGAYLTRTYGGSSPDGEPVAKTDTLVALYVSNEFIPVFLVTAVNQGYTSLFTATNANGQTTTLLPSSIIMSTAATDELPVLGDYLVYYRGTGDGAKIYAGTGASVAPCEAYSYARVCSRQKEFSSAEYLNFILDPDPLKVRFISETFANVIAGACENDNTSSLCLCGDALGGSVSNVPVGKNILPSTYTYLLQVLNYETLVKTPYYAMGPNATLWDWWVATINQVSIPVAVNNFNTFQQVWGDVRCLLTLANYIPPGSSVDFFHTLWMNYVNPTTFTVDLPHLLAYFSSIYQTANYFTCGNCVLYTYSNGTLIPPPRDANGTVPQYTCDPAVGYVLQPSVQPDYSIDAIKTFENVFCRLSSAYIIEYQDFDDTQDTWSFTATMRPGVGTMSVVFNTPDPGAIYALTSSSICPLVTNGTTYDQSVGAAHVSLTNPFPFALSFYFRVRQNESELPSNNTDPTDVCNYDKIFSIRENSTTVFPVSVCTGISYYQIWNSLDAFNCTPAFEVNQVYNAYYAEQKSKVTIYSSVYQSQLFQNQQNLDNSVARLNSEFNQQLQLQQIELLTINNSFIAGFNQLYFNEQQLSANLSLTQSATISNTQQIAGLQVGYVQVQNNLTSINNTLVQVEVNAEITQGQVTNLSSALGNETAAREQEAAYFEGNITVLQKQVDNITDNLVPELVNASLEALERAQFFSDAAKFVQTGWGQYTESQVTGLAIGIGIVGVLAAAAFIWSGVNYKFIKDAQKMRMQPPFMNMQRNYALQPQQQPPPGYSSIQSQPPLPGGYGANNIATYPPQQQGGGMYMPQQQQPQPGGFQFVS